MRSLAVCVTHFNEDGKNALHDGTKRNIDSS